MSVLGAEVSANLITYQDYLSEGVVNRRYDIINGERIYMTQPTDGHQEIALNIAELFRQYQRLTQVGRTFIPPVDVFISASPLKTRQPDVFFISRVRYGGRTARDVVPLSPAPELVVEVLSPSDTRSVRQAKIADYCAVDVQECWLVSPEAETVEILRLTPEGPICLGVFRRGQSVQSLTFPDLILATDDIFRIEE